MIRKVPSPLITLAETKSFSRRLKRLRAKHARRPGPTGDRKDEGNGDNSGREEGCEGNQERQGRDDEEDVGEDVEQPIREAAQVAGGHADDQAQQRDQQAHCEADQQRNARAGDHLGEHILPLAGGAEPMLRRRRLILAGDEASGVTGRKDGSKDGHQDKDTEDDDPEEGLALAQQTAKELALRRLAGFEGGVEDFPAEQIDFIEADMGFLLQVVRTRGSRRTYSRSTMKLAIRMARVIMRNKACISG